MELSNNKSPRDKASILTSPSINKKYVSATYPLPNLSPRKKISKTVYGDRYIPNRSGVDISAAFSLSNHEFINDYDSDKNIDSDLDVKRKQEANMTFSTILKAELFGDNVPSATPPSSINSVTRSAAFSSNNEDRNPNFHPISDDNDTPNTNLEITRGIRSSRSSTAQNSPEKIVLTSAKSTSNLLTFKSPRKNKATTVYSPDVTNEVYSLSPVRSDSQRLLLSPQKKPRQISKIPYRVLDAPELADDFYLNLVDWSSQNILAVGLGSCVYLWDAITGSVDRLCDLGEDNKITSLSWIGAGTHIAIGTSFGYVEVWDASACRCTRTMGGHDSRVGSLAWNEHILSSGSRDRSILNRDVRVPEHYINKLENIHKQEICGLKWNSEENKLASGGNDNKLIVWDGFNNKKPLHVFDEHCAAIKAISWNPHQRGVLASGGGTADRRIKIWNTLTGSKLNDVDTGSQVCNLIWSKNSHELVSTHGYSKNQVVIWKYNQNNANLPSNSNSCYQLSQIASLTGHTYRVLYLAMSPDGESIVTGAGDETLRFWKVFEKNKSENQNSVLLKSFMQLR